MYILACIGALQYMMLIFRLTSLCSLRWYIRRKYDNYVQIIYLYYDYMILHLQYHIIYINTHLSVIVPKSNPPLLGYLIWCSSSPLCFFSLPALLTNLQLNSSISIEKLWCVCQCIVQPLCKKVTWLTTSLLSVIN